MAIQSKDITPLESQIEQLGTYIMESQTDFVNSSKQAVERFVPHLKSKKVVDLGCGDGAATKFFKENDVEVTGVDINMVKLSLNPTKTVNTDIVSYLKKHKDIPNIFCHHALEHLPNPQLVLDLISNRLKKGGLIYIEVPANDHIHTVHHSTFDSPEDLLPRGFKIIEQGSEQEEHYLIARKP